MLSVRVIPVLLYKNNGLYKSVKFDHLKYVGDPINVIKIFNDKDADEIIFLDINASKVAAEPDYKMIGNIASECFMPLCYGGGIRNIEQVKRIFGLGIEKIALNFNALSDLKLIEEAAALYGCQSIVGAVDSKKNMFGAYHVYNHVKSKNSKLKIENHIQNLEQAGAGEILLTSVDKDGTMAGYDLDLLSLVSSKLSIPLIACGGAGSLNDFKIAVSLAKVSAVAAGSFFVFQGKHRAVLITYPKYEELVNLFYRD